MTKNKILTDLYQSKEVADLLAKMQPENLRDDIKQELFLALCEYPDEKIITLHEKKQLKFFAVRIVLNMVASKKSRFYYKFRKNTTVEFTNFTPLSMDIDIDCELFEKEHTDLMANVHAAMADLPWYQKEILTQYVEHGSAGKMVKDMNQHVGVSIPRRSIMDAVNKARKTIRERVAK